MPALPTSAVSLHGGCGCRAIRYTLTIPEESSRPIFYKSEREEVRYPLMLIDHCNDCRRATGSLINAWTMCPMDYVEFSLLLRVETSNKDGSLGQVAAVDAFRSGPKTSNTYLQHYQSPIKEQVTRMFCGRCGTCFGYTYHPIPEGFVPSVDLLLGTLDREDLEKIRMDRHVWWDCGIGWVQKLLSQGDSSLLGHKLPRHPTIFMDQLTEEYVNEQS